MQAHLFHALALTPLALALAAPIGAQCAGGDNLDGLPCCTPVDLALPTLPDVSLQSQGICWDDCNVASQTRIPASKRSFVPRESMPPKR